MYNNPAEEAYFEVKHKEEYYYKQYVKKRFLRLPAPRNPVQLLLSIGTGGDDSNAPPNAISAPVQQRTKTWNFITHIRQMGDRLTKEVTNTKRVDESMRKRSGKKGWRYVRWSGGTELENLELDKWKDKKGNKPSTQESIEKWINTYMSDSARSDELDEIAEFLVRVRRRRTQFDGERWKRWIGV